MAKFMILYNSVERAQDQMANATEEQMKASMDEWIKWKQDAEKTVKFEWGMPLQIVSKISTSGESASAESEVGGYSIIEGDLEEILGLLKTHPHLERPGATIDLLEMLPMPGM